jgi:serine/threonine-protein kinase
MLDSLIADMVVAGRYRLESRFAAGAWGSLWHALDEQTQVKCTVRLADAGVVDLKVVRERFQREVQAAKVLRCENVVNVLDHGEWSGMPFVVFESLSGEDLATRLRREGRLSPGQVIELVSDVAHALTRAHDLGLVHRDLKPENIFLIRVGSNEIAKVLDFGVTGGGPGASLDRSTKVGHHLGQPLYTSPEQATAGQIDFRSDLWALAVIAFHCFVGRPPFESDALAELLTQIASAPLPKLHALDPDLPPTLDAWCENALSRDPELRFQSAEELSEALARAFQRATLTGHPPPEWRSREARRAATTEAAKEDLAWLSAIPDASARDNFSEAPLSRQRAYWGAGSDARKRALRVSVGAVLGLMLVTLGVAVVRDGPAASTMAEASLQRPKAPARPDQLPSNAQAVAAESKPAAMVEPIPDANPAVEPAEAATLTPAPVDPVPCQAPAAIPASAARETPRPNRPKLALPVADESAPARATRKGESRRENTLARAAAEPDYGI